MNSKFHLSIDVENVDRSVAFYEAFFNAEVHKRRPGYANFDLEMPPLKLALNEVGERKQRGALNHMGIVLNSMEEVQAVRERLENQKLVSFDEGDTVCCYARQDKVWVQDPDGNRWEVYVLLDDMLNVEMNHHAGNAACCDDNDACCSGQNAVCCA